MTIYESLWGCMAMYWVGPMVTCAGVVGPMGTYGEV